MYEGKKPLFTKFSAVEVYQCKEINTCAMHQICNGTQIVSNVVPIFDEISEASFVYDLIVIKVKKSSVGKLELHWLYTMLVSNKTVLSDTTYQALRSKYSQSNLTEFDYQFNRCYNLTNIITRFAYMVFTRPPILVTLLKNTLAFARMGLLRLKQPRCANRLITHNNRLMSDCNLAKRCV